MSDTPNSEGLQPPSATPSSFDPPQTESAAAGGAAVEQQAVVAAQHFPAVRVPVFAGGRIESAEEQSRMSGWDVVVRDVEPDTKDQDDGLVVSQKPDAGSVVTSGSVVVLDVVKSKSFGQKHRAGIAWISALLAVAVAVLLTIVVTGESDSALQDDLDAATIKIAQLNEQVLAAAGDAGQIVAEQNTQIEALNAEVAALTAENTEVSASNEQLTLSLETQQADLDAAVAANAELTTSVEDLRAQLDAIDAQVETMIDFVGQQVVAAEQFADQLGLDIKITEVSTGNAAAGTVLSQSPAAGVPLVEGSTIWMEVFAPATAD